MPSIAAVDDKTGRKFFLDDPDDLGPDEQVVFLLNLHGGERRTMQRPTPPPDPDCDFSFIFAVGEHEIESLPQASPWAEKYGAAPRKQMPDVVDTEPGQIWDTSREGYSTKAWGLKPGPGTAQVFVSRDGRVIADIVRLDKGHTEGLEPNITEEIIKLMIREPGGKVARD